MLLSGTVIVGVVDDPSRLPSSCPQLSTNSVYAAPVSRLRSPNRLRRWRRIPSLTRSSLSVTPTITFHSGVHRSLGEPPNRVAARYTRRGRSREHALPARSSPERYRCVECVGVCRKKGRGEGDDRSRMRVFAYSFYITGLGEIRFPNRPREAWPYRISRLKPAVESREFRSS